MEKKLLKRSDYKPLDFTIFKTDLKFNLQFPCGVVTSTLRLKRLNSQATTFKLDGQKLKLESIKINSQDFTDYKLVDLQGPEGFQDLIIDISSLDNQDEFELQIVNQFEVENNLTLSGIYKAGKHVISQCEAHGFRLITFYFDRPDCLSEFTVYIEADQKFKYLLSNGNKISEGTLDNGRHFCNWHDPFPKPCYLFAFVAGDFDVIEDVFVTRSGRSVDLKIFAEIGKKEKLRFAMSSIKRAMKWDEDRFGLEYDLDLFMIVATSYFNMGAMENKGLNIFNDSCLIGDKDTATDRDLVFIDSVVAHEYFHNWTGDRVTCRDWFQLTLKEGLTVFRDQEYTSDTFNRTVKRIQDVSVMETRQFDEDRGPMSHPIRPDSVQSQDNFYTVTVYEKGAEVIRMIHTLLGEDGFQKGMKLYFKRHDGQAVTCDDFVNAMADASGVDLTSFKRWYSQSGTPRITIDKEYNPQTKVLTLNFTQQTLPTNDQKDKQPLKIILKSEFIDNSGKILHGLTTTDGLPVPQIISFDTKNYILEVANLESEPLFVTNLDFSCPVSLTVPYSLDDLVSIALNSENLYARYNAINLLNDRLFKQVEQDISTNKEVVIPEIYYELNEKLLAYTLTDPSFYATLIKFPSANSFITKATENVNPFKAQQVVSAIRLSFYNRFKDTYLKLYQQLSLTPYEYSFEQVGIRSLRGVLLGLLNTTAEHKDLVVELFEKADNLTDRINAMNIAVDYKLGLDQLAEQFAQNNKSNDLVLDYYLTVKGKAANTIADLEAVTKFETYDRTNPNRVRSFISGLFQHPDLILYRDDNSIFTWMKDLILDADTFNPHLSSALAASFLSFYKFEEPWKGLMLGQIESMINRGNLTVNLEEVLTKAKQMSSQI